MFLDVLSSRSSFCGCAGGSPKPSLDALAYIGVSIADRIKVGGDLQLLPGMRGTSVSISDASVSQVNSI